jgi:biopolymer transport protein ExbD
VNFYARRRRNPQVIIVALIDIFAILLIFMVMTTQFKEDKPQVTIKLPETVAWPRSRSSRSWA